MAGYWSRLPIIPIIKILSFLEPIDRVAAAATCSHWFNALQSPLLWRNITVKLLPLHDMSLKMDILSQLAQDFGKHMQQLELVWKCPKKIFVIMSEAYGVKYINVLISELVQVKKLVLTHWDCSYKSTNRHKIIQALNRFLCLQFGLEELCLMNANMRRHEILRLLSSVAQNSIHLKHLDLRSAFRGWQSPYPTPKYLLILRSFPNLTNLQVDYRSLCDPVLETISTTSFSLKHLEVNISPADSSMYRHLAISDRGWQLLKTSCPNLEVSFVVADVRLNLRNNRELMDDILLEIIRQCKKLKNLQFDGIIQNLEILPSILSMELDSAPHFKTIKFSPRILNSRNRSLLQNVVFEYKKKLSARNIDFNVDDLFPVFFN